MRYGASARAHGNSTSSGSFFAASASPAAFSRSETNPLMAFIIAFTIGGGSSPSPVVTPETEIDTPGTAPSLPFLVRWLFFCLRTRSRLAHSRQTYSSSASPPSRDSCIAVSASF